MFVADAAALTTGHPVDHRGAQRRQGAQRLVQGVATGGLQRHVDSRAGGEPADLLDPSWVGQVDGVVGARGERYSALVGAAGRRDDRAGVGELGDLHGEAADASRGRRDEQALAGQGAIWVSSAVAVVPAMMMPAAWSGASPAGIGTTCCAPATASSA